MPKLHPVTGLAACGTAGGRISYGSKTGEQFGLCDGGCSFWFNKDEIAFIGPENGTWDAGGRTLPQRVNIHTGQRAFLERVPSEQLRQANFMGAGGNRFQCGIAGPVGASFGDCGDFPGGSVTRAMTDGRGAAAEDGTIGLIDSYQGTNNGFRLGRPDGTVYPTPKDAAGHRLPAIAEGTDPYQPTIVDKDRAIWAASGAWGTFGITPAPVWIPASGRACWVEVGGVPYLVHWLGDKGLVARRADSTRGKVLSREDKEFHYDAIPWAGGIRIAWALWDGEAPGSLVIDQWDCQSDLEDLVEPPVPVVYPEYHFTHPLIIVPFKDPENTSRALAEVLVNENNQGDTRRPLFVAEDTLGSRWNGPLLGIYTEGKADISKVIAEAEKRQTRVLWCHDSDAPLVLPTGLRKWDIPAMELYWYKKKGETLAQAVARWRRDFEVLLRWPGDLALVPMFYRMGAVPGDLSVGEVLQTLMYLNEFANRSSRIKLLLPFSYLRANGITANPELQRSHDDLLAAAPPGVSLIPVEKPKPPDPPEPVVEFIYNPKEYPVANEEVGAIKVGPNFGRVVEAFAGKGPFGWYAIAFDRETPDDDCWWTLTKPDARHQLIHTKVPCWFGGDQKEAEDFIFYGKPTNNPTGRGILESPVLMNDPTKSGLVIGVITWPNRHPQGGVAAPSFAWVKR